MSDDPIRVLLGPQNPERNIDAGLNGTGIPEGQVAVISAAELAALKLFSARMRSRLFGTTVSYTA